MSIKRRCPPSPVYKVLEEYWPRLFKIIFQSLARPVRISKLKLRISKGYKSSISSNCAASPSPSGPLGIVASLRRRRVTLRKERGRKRRRRRRTAMPTAITRARAGAALVSLLPSPHFLAFHTPSDGGRTDGRTDTDGRTGSDSRLSD